VLVYEHFFSSEISVIIIIDLFWTTQIFNHNRTATNFFSIVTFIAITIFQALPAATARAVTPEKMICCEIIIQQLDNYPTVGRLTHPL